MQKLTQEPRKGILRRKQLKELSYQSLRSRQTANKSIIDALTIENGKILELLADPEKKKEYNEYTKRKKKEFRERKWDCLKGEL